jgi:hypothetical protein
MKKQGFPELTPLFPAVYDAAYSSLSDTELYISMPILSEPDCSD